MLIDVAGPLEKLAAGEADTACYASIPNAEVKLALRDMIEKTARDRFDLEVVIRDDTDRWMPIPADQLVVLRFSDYLTAYGVPA